MLFDELLRARDRLAGLSPLTPADLSPVAVALHEVVWFFMAASKADRPRPLPSALKRLSHDRAADLYATLVATLAVKLTGLNRRQTAASVIQGISDGLDTLTFDFRATKAETLERLTRIRTDITERIRHIRHTRRPPFRFNTPPEKYSDRKVRSENPERFLRRVYGIELERGLTQADIRATDPGFYNVLHVWCTRHGKPLAKLLPPSRMRAR